MRVSMALSQGGRGLQRRLAGIKRTVLDATIRATNKTGAAARREGRTAIASALNVTVKSIRQRERVYHATRRNPTYTVRWRRHPMFPVADIKGRRFRASRREGRGGFQLGRLTLRTYDKTHRFDVVRRGNKFWFVNERGAGKRVYGTFLPRGSLRDLDKLRGRIPAMFRREFVRARKGRRK